VGSFLLSVKCHKWAKLCWDGEMKWKWFKFSFWCCGLYRYDGLHHGSSYLEHLSFLSAIRGRGEKGPSVDLQDGLVSVAIGVAAQLSIEYGRFVTIQEVMNEHLEVK